MDNAFKDVSDSELEVLEILWAQGPCTTRQVTESLHPQWTDANYATVQKFLERLETKGHVGRDSSGRAHVFRARTGRDVLVGQRLRVVAEKLTGGLMGPLLTHLVKAETLTPRERQALRDLMDELDRSIRNDE
jgi:predicted transcriptional regulator